MFFVAKIVGLVALCSSVMGLYFDCRRYGQICQATGTCIDDDGKCKCVNPEFGHDCGGNEDARSADPADCFPPCEHGGTCLSGYCYCTDEFSGDVCENRRAISECNGDSIDITITPYPIFYGKVYVKMNQSDAACEFLETTPGTYKATLGFTSGCSINKTVMTDSTRYETEITIQNSPVFETGLDIILAASCIQSDAPLTALDGGIAAISVDQQLNQTEDEATTTYNPIDFAVLLADGMPIAPPLYLFTPIKLYFPLKDTGRYVTLGIVNCDAVSGALRVSLIENKCPTVDGKSVMIGNIMYDNVPSASVMLRAFRFPDSSSVSFECIVQLCERDNAIECNPEECNSVRRKRRSISNDSHNSEIMVKETVTVLDRSGYVQEPDIHFSSETTVKGKPRQNDPDNNLARCFQPEGIVVIIVILVVAVVLLLIVTMCLTVRFIKSKSQVKVNGCSSSTTDNSRTRVPKPIF